MPDENKLITKANGLMDAYDWAGARDLYRKAFLHTLPRIGSEVTNLRLAETYERVEYWQQLWKNHPDSYAVWSNLIAVLAESRRASQVVKVCTQILKENDSVIQDVDQIRRVRWLRFRAAVGALTEVPHAGPYETVPDDFAHLWESGSQADLLTSLASLADPKAIPVLEVVAGQVGTPQSVKRFVVAKIHELRILAELIQNYKQLIKYATRPPTMPPGPDVSPAILQESLAPK